MTKLGVDQLIEHLLYQPLIFRVIYLHHNLFLFPTVSSADNLFAKSAKMAFSWRDINPILADHWLGQRDQNRGQINRKISQMNLNWLVFGLLPFIIVSRVYTVWIPVCHKCQHTNTVYDFTTTLLSDGSLFLKSVQWVSVKDQMHGWLDQPWHQRWVMS